MTPDLGTAGMTSPAPYTCATCGAVYVVPALARACEATHREENR